MSKNRAAIYVFYDKDGIVDSYVIHMLQELSFVCGKIVVVCNCQVNEKGKEALSSITEDIVIRENEGFDAWAYKAGITYIGWDNLGSYDELVLLNDSVFGPIYPFDDMFEAMEPKNLDFWGITKHGQLFDSLKKKKQIYPEHIQSYFYTITKKMFLNPEFKKYWNNLRMPRSWKETVSLFEARFTEHFAGLGFTWDVYVNTDEELGEFSDVDQILQMLYELIKTYRCPVVKRKSFSIDYGNFLAFTLGDSTRKAFDYIKNSTDYNTELIWDHILRAASLRNIVDNLNLNYILPKDYINGKSFDTSVTRVALFAHITYEDQIEFLGKYIESVAEFAHVYITTLTEQTKEKLLDRFGRLACKKLEVFVLPKNRRGRDVGALWVALRPYMESYDYICFVHNKKSSQDRPLTIGRGFAERCLENTLGSKEYVTNIINTFENNPRLGMLFPPPVMHGPYRALLSNLWGDNYKNTIALAERLNIDVPIEIVLDPIFPTGGMFWFKVKALRKLIEYDWKYENFQEEPLPTDGTLGHAFERIYSFASQSEGFYSAWILNEHFISTEITSLHYILASVQLTGWHLYRYKAVVFLKKNPKVYVILRGIYRLLKKILLGKSGK